MNAAARHALVAQFRARVFQQYGIVLFPHQASWQLASEGWELLPTPPAASDPYVTVCINDADILPHDLVSKRLIINDLPAAHVRRAVKPRTTAHVTALLGAYKQGKSFSLAGWASGFAILPDAKVEFVGLEYGTSEPEFNYLLEFLLSSRGMSMPYTTMQNDKRGGRMRLVLKTGASYEVRSWNQKESLKGAKIDAYVYTEAYQLPGLECYTSVSQNLRERKGFAVFATTPDRPWVKELHKRGHGRNPDWHCTCGIDARHNPYTFSQKERDQDDPDKGGLMTREQFQISWEGKLGSFVGRVYQYQHGGSMFTPASHPWLWNRHRLDEYSSELAAS